MKAAVDAWLAEDLGPEGLDITSLACIPEDAHCEAYIVAKASGVVCGLEVASYVFSQCGVSDVHWLVEEGQYVDIGTRVCDLHGPTRAVMKAERTALNIMQRMGGIATMTRRMATLAHPAVLLDTRKTAPGLRQLDKLAVRAGGGHNHRMGLWDMVMIKDNHIAGAGGIKQAVASVHAWMESTGRVVPIEVEARTLDEVREVLEVSDSVQRIMLDNMVCIREGSMEVDTTMLEAALRLIAGRIETEASGNVTMDTVGPIGATGVTYISSGALTHSVTALDLSLKLV